MMRSSLVAQFQQAFGGSMEGVRVFFAPGRVNLIGEHTDYTGGYVFPAALTYGTWVVVRPRQDGEFRFVSTSFPLVVTRSGEDLAYRPEDDWANYPKGMIQALKMKGWNVPGCDMLFHGNIPSGAGLSSSASIELVTGVALQTLAGADLTRIALVQLAQRVENDYIGVHCGVMDQFAVGMGKRNHAILLKCDTLKFQHVPLSLGDYRLVITHTNKRRGLADSKYNERRRECEAGFRQLQRWVSGVRCLGDVRLEQWEEVKGEIGDETIRRRLEHVVRENFRVLASQKALEDGDLAGFARLMIASHESLRDLYEVTGPELDALFEEQVKAEGCLGSRMTGAGFGGCTVSLVHHDALPDFQREVARGYERRTGLRPIFYICDTGDGAREVTEEVMTVSPEHAEGTTNG